jgi:RNA polymerase sigma factor (sigma-70 family)
MAPASIHPLLCDIRQFATSFLDDRELLERFARRRDEAAFAALVRRHGPLVLSVCRRVLGDWHAAEDAFQGTFLVLARQAASVKWPEALGPWLHGVASRTALKARTQAARRRACERQAAVLRAAECGDDVAWRDLRPLLDEVIAGLPERYRVPFVLCYLEGRTVSEIARRLCCPRGTIATRLARARQRLRNRLARCGVGLSGALLPLGFLQKAALPASLVSSTIQAATGIAAGPVAAGLVSTSAAALMRGVLNVMILSKLKVAALTLAVGVAGIGIGLSLHGKPGPTCSTIAVSERTPTAPVAAGKQFKDVVVRVEETQTGSLLFGVGVNSDAGLTGSILLNERNFDMHRPPESLERGCRFRGAGQEFRVPVRSDDRLYVVPFLDSGTVEPDAQHRDHGTSTGGGAYLTVPALGPVPIALDFGFPVVRESKEPGQVFSFWIGFFA